MCRRQSNCTSGESTGAVTNRGAGRTDASAPRNGFDDVQAPTPPAQDRARCQSRDEAHEEEPACASLVPARRGRRDEAAHRGDDSDRE
jgi:hypothetical protein